MIARSRVAASARRLLSLGSTAQREVDLSHDGSFSTLTLCNPDKHNAFSDVTIKALTAALGQVPASSRGLFVKAMGKSFCAGYVHIGSQQSRADDVHGSGDVAYMRKLAAASKQDNAADARGLARLLRMLHDMPMPTIALVQGPAYGGGVGLISACDVSVSVKTAMFALSEVKLGLIPATISPYVIARMGVHFSKRYFMTAEAMDATRAFHVGLVDEVVDSEADLGKWEAKFKEALNRNAPLAVKGAKTLVDQVAHKSIDEALMHETAQLLADKRASLEGVEGVSAFLEKRAPKWLIS